MTGDDFNRGCAGGLGEALTAELSGRGYTDVRVRVSAVRSLGLLHVLAEGRRPGGRVFLTRITVSREFCRRPAEEQVRMVVDEFERHPENVRNMLDGNENIH